MVQSALAVIKGGVAGRYTIPLKVQKYNIENQWLETSLDDLPHSQVRRSTESDRGESGSYVESPSGHL